MDHTVLTPVPGPVPAMPGAGAGRLRDDFDLDRDLDLDLDGDLDLDLDLDCDLDCDRDLDHEPEIEPEAEPDLAPAPLRLQAMSAILDGVLIAAGTAPPILIAAWALPVGVDLTRALLPAALALAALVAIAYGTLAHGLLGATPGERLLGIAVADRDGGTPGMGRAALRASLALVGTLALGAGLWPAVFTRSRRTLHDRLAGTRVVRAP